MPKTPEAGSDGDLSPTANGIVPSHMAQLFGRDRVGADGPLHAHSMLGKDAVARLAAVAGTTHIYDRREAEAADLASFNEMAALMEEAPGA